MTTDHVAKLARGVAAFALRRDPDAAPEVRATELGPAQLKLGETIHLVHEGPLGLAAEDRSRLQRMAGRPAPVLVVKVREGRA